MRIAFLLAVFLFASSAEAQFGKCWDYQLSRSQVRKISEVVHALVGKPVAQETLSACRNDQLYVNLETPRIEQSEGTLRWNELVCKRDRGLLKPWRCPYAEFVRAVRAEIRGRPILLRIDEDVDVAVAESYLLSAMPLISAATVESACRRDEYTADSLTDFQVQFARPGETRNQMVQHRDGFSISLGSYDFEFIRSEAEAEFRLKCWEEMLVLVTS